MFVNQGHIIKQQKDRIKLLKPFKRFSLPASINGIWNIQHFEGSLQWQQVALEATKIGPKENYRNTAWLRALIKTDWKTKIHFIKLFQGLGNGF